MAPMRLLTLTATRAHAVEAQQVTSARNALVAAENEVTAARAALTTATNEARDARALATAAVPEQTALTNAAISKEATQRVAQARFDTANAAATTARATYHTVATSIRDPAAIQAALAELMSAEAALADARQARDSASDADRAAAQQRVNIATAAVERRRAAHEQLVAALGPPRETIEVTMGAAIGDRNTRFVANVNTNWFRSARGRIVVGQNGLLQSANLTVDGQLDEILVGVAQSIVAINASGGGGVQMLGERERALRWCGTDGTMTEVAGDGLIPAAGADGLIPAPAALAPTTLSLSFDPVVKADVDRVNQALCGAGFSYRIDLRDDPLVSRRAVIPPASAGREPVEPLTASFNVMCGQTVNRGVHQRRRCPGLVYRQNEPMSIDIVRFDIESGRRTYVERSFNFSVPNGAPVDVLRYDDAIFVTRRDDVGFVDGSLVSLDFDRPSEAAVLASTPLRIVRGVTEAASEIVQLRVNLGTRQAELARAEQAAAAAQASEGANAEIAQLEAAHRLLQLRLQVEEARQRLQEAEAAADGTD